ncbi:putative disease resistance RPP13-like protein 3 [Nicotiana tomentosiformis]|uniref:putative disease resistance RPP13-like protein 3 n=1 Tax=Nicotiana tomentosiformis TaxID=4098 RepID=UPI00051B4A89|nr:putative disease resistance RPP13-like protein 3 [Nicotiana tomentosiformis]
MASAAVISLLQTLEQRNPELFHNQTANTLESLRATAEYILNVLEKLSKSRFDPEKIKSLEEKIRVAASDAEDVVEVKIFQIIRGLSWTFGILQHQDLLPIVEKMDITKKELMEIVSDFSTSTHDADDNLILESTLDSRIGTSSRSNLMLGNLEDDIVQGLDDDLEIIVKRLTGPPSDLDIVTISGMGCIGKTTLGRKAYDNLPIRYHFDIRVWVTISQEYRSRNVLLDALHCISKQTNIVKVNDYDTMDDCELPDLVQKNLKGPRYLVVVDDIWSRDVWDSIRGIFPNYNNGSQNLIDY